MTTQPPLRGVHPDLFKQIMDERLDTYWRVLQESRLADKSIEDYYYFAMCFARWMEGSFTPGENVR